MTELRDELKIRPGEGAVDYAERIEAVLEEHRVQTGERLTAHGTMPGEGPGEVLERLPVLKVADGIRSSERARHRAREGNGTNRGKDNDVTIDTSATADDSSRQRSFRIKSQERDVEKAVSEFEAAKKRLYRSDGSKVYGDEEHAERLGKLTDGLREKAEAVAAEARSDIEGYERAVLASSYTDPASLVPASDRGRLETSRVFVKEDCEALTAPALTERLEAVSAGSDKVAPVLFARYARTRLEALEAESSRLAGEGRPAGAEKVRENRALGEAVARLEAALEDPQKVKRVQGLKEAAEESRRVARTARARVSELDGTDEAARASQRTATRGAF